MKLRVRSSQSKETLKIEVSNSCTLSQLRRILSETLPNSPYPASIRLSLNRKDELQSDGEDSLQFHGISSGELIFFSVEHTPPFMSSNRQSTDFPVTDSSPTTVSDNSDCSTSLDSQTTLLDVQNHDVVMSDSQKGEILYTGSQMEETVNSMEIDDEDGENSYNRDVLLEQVDKSFSVPGFLRKVFAEELGDDCGRDHEMVVIAVHAVMLESGFVGFDEKAKSVVNGFRFRNEWPSGLFTLSLSYTLPESPSDGGAVKTVVLKFQTLGIFMNVYGILGSGSGKRSTHSVRLNEEQLVPFLNVVWANCGTTEIVGGKGGVALGTSPEKEVFKFWRTVKDNMALPLLIDFCEEAGYELPPCFMRLPTELKLKILEFLPGVDVASVCCVCSELRYIGSSDDIWKLKVSEEFSNEKNEAEMSWKKVFSMAWSRRIGRKLASRVRASPFWPPPYWPQPRRRRYPNTFMVPRVPRITRDDYDVASPYGDDLQTGLHGSLNQAMRIFSPQCNLGVRGGRFI